ncbi:hypothetical protein SUGI_0417860 [Cryptomeria japonica]|nr:hypothetical protein SUGI_0417860 [Cryptomeria japonica]
MNLNGWEVMIALGFNVVVSVRVSNELGAGLPSATKFVVVAATILLGCLSVLFWDTSSTLERRQYKISLKRGDCIATNDYSSIYHMEDRLEQRGLRSRR